MSPTFERSYISHENETKKVVLRLSVSVKDKKNKQRLLFVVIKKKNEFLSSWKNSHSASQKNSKLSSNFERSYNTSWEWNKKSCASDSLPPPKRKKSYLWLLFFRDKKKKNEFPSSWKNSHSASQKIQNWALIFKDLQISHGNETKKVVFRLSMLPWKREKNYLSLLFFRENKRKNEILRLVEKTPIRLVRKIQKWALIFKDLTISHGNETKKVALGIIASVKVKKNKQRLGFVVIKKKKTILCQVDKIPMSARLGKSKLWPRFERSYISHANETKKVVLRLSVLLSKQKKNKSLITFLSWKIKKKTNFRLVEKTPIRLVRKIKIEP